MKGVTQEEALARFWAAVDHARILMWDKEAAIQKEFFVAIRQAFEDYVEETTP